MQIVGVGGAKTVFQMRFENNERTWNGHPCFLAGVFKMGETMTRPSGTPATYSLNQAMKLVKKKETKVSKVIIK